MGTTELKKNNRRSYVFLVAITLTALATIIIAIFWIDFLLTNSKGLLKDSPTNLLIGYLVSNIVFAIVFISLIFLLTKIYKINTNEQGKENELDRKMRYEQSQFISFNNTKQLEEIGKLNDRVSQLETTINGLTISPDYMENRNRMQAILLLSIGLTSQDESFKHMSVPDKLKQIDENYKALKEKIKDIKL